MAKKKYETYYVPFAKYSFSVDVLDEDGNKIPRLNVDGNKTRVGAGFEVLSKTYQFEPVLEHPERKLSIFRVNENTLREVIERLEQLADDPNTRVLRHKDHIKQTNPAQAAEMARREKLEKEVEDLRAKNDESEKTIKVLKKSRERHGESVNKMRSKLKKAEGK